MKTVADSFKDAPALLRDLMDFERVASDMAIELQSYEVGGAGKTLPRYITETATELRGLLIRDFSMTYPSIHHLVENGLGGSDASFSRLYDAVYKFNAVQQALNKSGCVVMQVDQREELYNKMADVVSDIVIFVIIQFNLHHCEEEVTLAIEAYCKRCGLTPDILLGLLTQDMQDLHRSWYAYEALSPYCQALNECDSQLVSEMEDNLIPFTDEMAKDLIEGNLSIAAVRNYMAQYLKGVEEVEVNVTPTSLLSQMQLK